MSSSKKARTLRADACEAMQRCAGHQVRMAARRITRYLDAQMRDTGLGIEQFHLLAEIAATDDDSLTAIADSAGLDKSTLSRSLQALEKRGLVEIATHGTGSRRRVAWLTEQGARMLERAMPRWRSANAALARLIDLDVAKGIVGGARKLPLRRRS